MNADRLPFRLSSAWKDRRTGSVDQPLVASEQPPPENRFPFDVPPWQIYEAAELRTMVPLERLVIYVRCASQEGDWVARNQLLEIILWRLQDENEMWVKKVLKRIVLHSEERRVLIIDLYADLCEGLIRALIDPSKQFWEQNFLHCLRFERQHIYRTFMMREGRWFERLRTQSRRVPRTMLASLEQKSAASDSILLNLEDAQAAQQLLLVEQDDLLQSLLGLPEHLRSVVLLVFWKECSEKEIAQLLGVSDRTVRNRLRKSLAVLRTQLQGAGDCGA